MYYQVFIDGAYIRDAQAYLAGQADENSEYVLSDEGWEDIESDALFIGREFEDLKELKEFVKRFSPDIDLKVLSVLEFPEKPVLIDWEGNEI